MSPIKAIPGRFALMVSQVTRSISEAKTVDMPAFSSPKSSPIAPVKKLKAKKGFFEGPPLLLPLDLRFSCFMRLVVNAF
jgi:hypothetical protein